MTVGEQVIFGTLVVYFLTLLVLIWQTRATRQEMRKTAIRNIYDRWLETTKMEVQYPELHKMFMDNQTLKALKRLSEDELRQRALSMFIFDQFAMIFNLGERKSLYARLDHLVKRILRRGRILAWWNRRVEANRTLFDLNEDYIRRIMSNPTVIRCWRDFKLGETWKDSEYYHYIDNLIEGIIKEQESAC